MRLTRLERAQQATLPKQEQTVIQTLEDVAVRCVGGPLSTPQRAFIFSPNFIEWFTGPYGSGKTSALVASGMIPAMIYPDSHFFLARNVFWTLKETTLKELEECVERIGPSIILDRQKGPPYEMWIASALRDADNRPCAPSKFTVHSLDDMGKLGSTKFTGVLIDEADEIDENIATAIPARCRKKRRGEDRPMGPFFVRFSSNPPRRSHWLHRKFCKEADCDEVPMGHKVQSTRFDNEHNLPPGYYEKHSVGMSSVQKLRYIEGQCGPDPAGDGVFVEDFNYDIHVVQDLWKRFDPKLPLIRGWDFGRRRPAVTFAQMKDDHLWRFASMLGHDISLERFHERVMNRTAMQFPGATTFKDFCDPHGNQKVDVSEETPVSYLQKKGLKPQWRDVSVNTGIEWMSKGLAKLVGKGIPRSQFDKDNCSLLIEGYTGGYCYPKGTKSAPVKEVPLKDGFYEHLMDSDRYIEVNLNMGSTTPPGEHRKVLRRVVNPYTGH